MAPSNFNQIIFIIIFLIKIVPHSKFDKNYLLIKIICVIVYAKVTNGILRVYDYEMINLYPRLIFDGHIFIGINPLT